MKNEAARCCLFYLERVYVKNFGGYIQHNFAKQYSMSSSSVSVYWAISTTAVSSSLFFTKWGTDAFQLNESPYPFFHLIRGGPLHHCGTKPGSHLLAFRLCYILLANTLRVGINVEGAATNESDSCNVQVMS